MVFINEVGSELSDSVTLALLHDSAVASTNKERTFHLGVILDW
jgi:hypothetical protein